MHDARVEDTTKTWDTIELFSFNVYISFLVFFGIPLPEWYGLPGGTPFGDLSCISSTHTQQATKLFQSLLPRTRSVNDLTLRVVQLFIPPKHDSMNLDRSRFYDRTRFDDRTWSTGCVKSRAT